MAQRPPSGSPGARGSVRTYVGHSFGGIVRECSGGRRGAVGGRTGRHLGVNGRSDREMKFLPVPAHPGKGPVPPLPPGASRKPTGRRDGFPTRPGDGFRGPPEGVAPAPERCRAVGSGLVLRVPPHIFRILVRNARDAFSLKSARVPGITIHRHGSLLLTVCRVSRAGARGSNRERPRRRPGPELRFRFHPRGLRVVGAGGGGGGSGPAGRAGCGGGSLARSHRHHHVLERPQRDHR